MEEKNFCFYCNKEAFFQLKNGKWCCCKSHNSCDAIRRKNSEGLKVSYKSGKIDAKKRYLKYSEESKRKQSWSKDKLFFSKDEIFCLGTSFSGNILKKYLIVLGIKQNKCEICGIEKWNNKEISFQVHHKDGNNCNNQIENLQILCPNCHSQTDNFSGRNKKRFSWDKITYQKLKELSKICKSYRQLLLSIGCVTISDATYKKLKDILSFYGIELKNFNKTKTCIDCGEKISKNAKRCKKCSGLKNGCKYRRAIRPDKETLEQEIKKNSFVQLGKKYNVSDNAIRKWCKLYNLPFRKKDLILED